MILFNPWTVAIAIATLLTIVIVVQQLKVRKLLEENKLLEKQKKHLQQKLQKIRFKPLPKREKEPVFDKSQTNVDFKFFERKAMEAVDQLINQAKRLSDNERYEEAESTMQKALTIADSKLGEDHHHRVRVLTWLGFIATQRADRLRANQYWVCALQIASEWDDKCDNDVSYIQENLRKNRDYLGF